MPAGVEHGQRRVRRILRFGGPCGERHADRLLLAAAQQPQLHRRSRPLASDGRNEPGHVLDFHPVQRDGDIPRLQPRGCGRRTLHRLHHLRPARRLPAELGRLLLGDIGELRAEPALGLFLRARRPASQSQPNQQNRNPPHDNPPAQHFAEVST